MKKFVTFLLVILFSVAVNAQQSLKSNLMSSKVTVSGTSTLHDWTSVVESFSISTIAEPSSFSNVRFECEVESIKSGKSGMDKNTYKAMNSSKYPKIYFKADELNINGSKVTGNGNLTIAGVTKQIPVNFIYESWTAGEYNIRGEVNFKMSEYGIEPPVAMLGAVKTGDQVTINLEITLTK